MRPPSVSTRAPLRLGLAGGGTDLDAYSIRFGGLVLNVTIDRYAYASVSRRDDDAVCFSAREMPGVDRTSALARLGLDEGLVLHRAVYNRFISDFHRDEPLPVSIATQVDAPMGSGLGASSALVVAMVGAFCRLLGVRLAPEAVADLALRIEREDMRLAGGKQDHYSAAMGGLNLLSFHADRSVVVQRLSLAPGLVERLQSSLVTCFTGQSRRSNEIISQQIAGIEGGAASTIAAMHQLKADAQEMTHAIHAQDVQQLARVLNRSWNAKKRTAAAITTREIDALYELAMSSGAIGGKISGAGGGGTMMFVVRPQDRDGLLSRLRDAGVDAVGVKLTRRGVRRWNSEGAGD